MARAEYRPMWKAGPDVAFPAQRVGPVDPGKPAEPLVLHLAEDAASLAAVRRWAAEALSDLTDDELGDCMLLVTELVTNAYDHGDSPRTVRLRRSTHPSRVRVEVDDASPAAPTLGHSRLGTTRGRGMVIVDKLAERWAVRPRPNGKTVWAELRIAQDSA